MLYSLGKEYDYVVFWVGHRLSVDQVQRVSGCVANKQYLHLLLYCRWENRQLTMTSCRYLRSIEIQLTGGCSEFIQSILDLIFRTLFFFD